MFSQSCQPLRYFIRILTNSSYKLCFYHSWKLHHRTPFTTALRDVKKVLARGQRATDCPQSDRGSPVHEAPLGYHTSKTSLFDFCAGCYTSAQNVLSLNDWFSSQNRSNNLSILPDLQSNRISIHSPTLSIDILGRSSVLWEILSLEFSCPKIHFRSHFWPFQIDTQL